MADENINPTPAITINRKNLFIKISVNLGVIDPIPQQMGTSNRSIIQEIINVTIDFNTESQMPVFLEKFKILLEEIAKGKKVK